MSVHSPLAGRATCWRWDGGVWLVEVGVEGDGGGVGDGDGAFTVKAIVRV